MKVPQFMPYVDMEEYEAIKSCFEINWITEGPKAKVFNQKLCDLIGVKYGVFAPNGTLALYLALKSIGIGPGDEVIVPNFTFIASANAVEMVGARPVFVDIDEDLQISTDDCKRVLSEKTKAIMPVHIYGFASDMTKVMKFAKENNLLIIEDAAQALAIKWDGRGCGSFGDVSTFSFFADKTLTTGEGGFVCTNDEKVYEKLLYLRNQGRIDRGSFIHPEIGYNFRMNDIQMAIGLTQLEKLPKIISLKQHNFNLYCELLKDCKSVEIIKPKPEVSPFIPFRVVLKVKEDNCQNLTSYMKENGIETRTFFYPLHLQPCFKMWSDDPRHEASNFPITIDSYEKGVCLPSFAALKKEEIEYVCNVIKRYYEEKSDT
jgi:perosamine synthetase